MPQMKLMLSITTIDDYLSMSVHTDHDDAGQIRAALHYALDYLAREHVIPAEIVDDDQAADEDGAGLDAHPQGGTQ